MGEVRSWLWLLIYLYVYLWIIPALTKRKTWGLEFLQALPFMSVSLKSCRVKWISAYVLDCLARINFIFFLSQQFFSGFLIVPPISKAFVFGKYNTIRYRLQFFMRNNNHKIISMNNFTAQSSSFSK